jgi:hypothetical protein
MPAIRSRAPDSVSYFLPIRQQFELLAAKITAVYKDIIGIAVMVGIVICIVPNGYLSFPLHRNYFRDVAAADLPS